MTSSNRARRRPADPASTIPTWVWIGRVSWCIFSRNARVLYITIPKSLQAFSLRINGRTSSRIEVFSKSAIQRSGVIRG